MNFWKTWIKGHLSHNGHLHTVLSLKDSAEAVAGSSTQQPPQPHSTDFPSATSADMEVHTSDEWLRVQIGSWPHLHCTTEGGTNCDYLALKPPPALWPFLNEALSPHIPHPGLPTISLKTLIFFRDYVHLFYPWCFSEHCFCFSFFHLTMCILNFTIFLSHISTIHKSTENNISIVNTHEPA